MFKINNLPMELIIKIMTYIYQLDIGKDIKPNMEKLDGRERGYKKIKNQCLDIINLF